MAFANVRCQFSPKEDFELPGHFVPELPRGAGEVFQGLHGDDHLVGEGHEAHCLYWL